MDESCGMRNDDSAVRLPQLLWYCVILVVFAGVPRILSAILLPIPDGDAFVYLETIHAWRASLIAGTFSIATLRDFWLPMYQLLCALISTVINYPIYVSRIVPALSGIGICVLVFLISLKLTTHRLASLAAAMLVALNPLHIEGESRVPFSADEGWMRD